MRFVRVGGGYNASHVAAEVDLLEPRQLLSATGGGGGEEEENSSAASPAEAWARYQDRVAIADGDYERSVDTAIGRYQSRTETADARLRTVFAAQNALFDTAAREAAVAFGEAGRIATTQYDAALDGADAALEAGVRAAFGTHTAALETADAKRDAAVLAATEAFGDAAAAETIKYGKALKSAEAAYRGKVYEADLEFLARAITAAETFEAAESAAWTRYDAELKAADERYDAALAAIDAGEIDRLAPAWGAYGAALQAAEDALEAAYDSSDGGYDESGDYEDPYAAAERAYDLAVAAAEQALYDAYDAVWTWRQGEEALAAFELYDSRQQAETDVYRKIDEAQALREAAVDAAHAEWVPKEAAAWTDHEAEVATADDEYADALLAPAGRYDEQIAAANAAWDAEALTANEEFLEDYAEASWGWSVEELGASFGLLVAEVTAQEQFDGQERTALAAYDSRMREALDEWHAEHDRAEADLVTDLADADADWANDESAAYLDNAAAFTSDEDGEGRYRAEAPLVSEELAERLEVTSQRDRWGDEEFLAGYRDDFKKHVPEELWNKYFQDGDNWPVHHRYQQAIGDMIEDLNLGVRMNDVKNLRILPLWVHEEITKEQDIFQAQVREGVNDVLEKQREGRPLTKDAEWADIIKHHPDRAKLAEQYNGLVRHLDAKFGQYWLKANLTSKDISNLARQMGMNTQGFFSEAAKSRVLPILQDRKSLAGMMSRFATRASGVLGIISLAAAGPAMVNAAGSDEMKKFIELYAAAIVNQSKGIALKQNAAHHLADRFVAVMAKGGLEGKGLDILRANFIKQIAMLPNG